MKRRDVRATRCAGRRGRGFWVIQIVFSTDFGNLAVTWPPLSSGSSLESGVKCVHGLLEAFCPRLNSITLDTQKYPERPCSTATATRAELPGIGARACPACPEGLNSTTPRVAFRLIIWMAGGQVIGSVIGGVIVFNYVSFILRAVSLHHRGEGY
ncbi:hypothetical protein FB451DRAFT_1216616 [Mycena latifolia]|nr:hypothetical protein FB451DRAFT_1216616 [Mycena latifolia]